MMLEEKIIGMLYPQWPHLQQFELLFIIFGVINVPFVYLITL